MSFKVLDEKLEINRVFFIVDYDLKSNSYSRTGHLVKRLICPTDIEQLILVLKFLNEEHKDYKVIGNTTNILFLDMVEYSVFISLKMMNRISFTKDVVSVESGRLLTDFVKDLTMRGFTGFEGLEGIPGNIGGALFMNAGAYGYSISDFLYEVTYLDESLNIVTKRAEHLEFGHRSSFFLKNPGCIILNCKFILKSGEYSDIEEKVQTYHIARHTYQEWVYPNLGSVFTSNYGLYHILQEKYQRVRYLLILFKIKNFGFIKKRFRKFKPNNRSINRIVLENINMIKHEHVFSSKSINTFANKNASSIDIIGAITDLNWHLDKRAVLENEILIENIYKVNNKQDFEKVNTMCSRIK
ncbi:FAD-binding protein [Vibrio campbellii]|uniref:FAD-binding protein n=1 Tax=Vibrio campbellii TaxID=680 RepID=UPI001F303808|nr:FAD-binding protein [Vibrio campbellii]MCE7728142.1 FAD-binding protein [Vibrio campbellii]